LIALQSRNFRLLWVGLFVSMAGSSMRTAAVLWHVSLLVPEGKKALALGGVGFVRFFAIAVCSMLAGVAADALDRRKLLLATNTSMLVISSALAAVTLAGMANLWLVYTLAGLGAAAGTFDNPARNSFFPSLVPREHLPNAISLNSIVFQAASVIGPSLGGLVIASSGIAWVYVLDASSFAFLIASLLMMRNLPARARADRSKMSFSAAREGILFVFRHPLIRSSMLLDFMASFFGSATALLPIFAQDVLDVGAHGYGLLASASATGAVLTSVVMVRAIDHIERRGRTLILAAATYGAVTIAFGLSSWFWLSLLCLFLAGAADMVSTVLRNVIRQLATPDELRGRMTSVNMLFFMGGPQLGEVEAGAVAQSFGPVASVVLGGIGCVVSVLWIGWRTPSLANYVAHPQRSER
jgi:MFS family permease